MTNPAALRKSLVLRVERTQRALIVDRHLPRSFTLERVATRQLIIDRAGLPGPPGPFPALYQLPPAP